ncbi:hypothetical protein BGS_0006 [Beggiatoa sp. SS]|nr:hypothetical protein BGS_0006 [Beggiatoa sp. SS]
MCFRFSDQGRETCLQSLYITDFELARRFHLLYGWPRSSSKKRLNFNRGRGSTKIDHPSLKMGLLINDDSS